MSSYDPSTAQILVFTFKDGPLSTVAFDLKLRVERFSITLEGETVEAKIDPSSLRVVCSMVDGEEAPHGLMASLFPDVERNLTSSVLKPERYPVLAFRGTLRGPSQLTGQLTLCGVTREVIGTRQRAGAAFELDQRDFGITPFSAMLGTMRVKPVVKVLVHLSG